MYNIIKNKKAAWRKVLTAEADAELRQAGALLAQARRRRKLSVSALAARMGVDRRTLAQLEAGSPAVSIGVFFQALSTLRLLRGMDCLLGAENDVEAISAAVRLARKGARRPKAISDEAADF